MTKKNRVYLKHIFEAITKIERYLQGTSRDRLEADEMLQDAVVRELEIIGEAASNLTKGFRSDRPAVPWNEIVAMRNKLTHEYFGVDLDIVWKTYQEDLPKLKSEIEGILGEA